MLALMAAVIAGGYGGRLDPSTWGALPALAVLAYPAAVVISAAIAAIVFLSGRRRWGAALLLAIIATWPTLRANFPFSRPDTTNANEPTMTVLSWNVAGWDSAGVVINRTENADMRLILNSGADIVALQEPTNHGWDYDQTRSTRGMRTELDSLYPYRSTGRFNGVALWSRWPMKILQILSPIPFTSQSGRQLYRYNDLAADITPPHGKPVRVVVSYMTSFRISDRKANQSSLFQLFSTAFAARATHARKLRAALDTCRMPVILCCDMNDVPASYAHRTLLGNDLRDAFALGGRGPQPTYADPHLPFHIDHILFRPSQNLRLLSYRLDSPQWSDHKPVIATFSLSDNH